MKKLLFGLVFMCAASFTLSLNGQYSAFTEGEDLYPLPNEGVVSIGSNTSGLVTKVKLFDETGSTGEVQDLPLERLGSFGDFVLSGLELYVIPSYWYNFDIIADMGFNLLNLSGSDVSVTYNSPFQYSSPEAEKSVGLGASSRHIAIAEGDSFHIISAGGTLVNSISLPEVYAFTEMVNLAGVTSSHEYALICRLTSSRQSTIHYLNADAEIVTSDLISGKLLDSWSGAGESILFFDEGYVALEAASLTPYPSSVGEIVAAYDAVDVAVLRNTENQYFSYTPSGGFVAISDPGQVIFKRIYKRPAGWYTLVNGMLTFDPNALSAPPENPLRIRLLADSAVTRVTYVGPSNSIPTTLYEVSYTIRLTNTSNDVVSAAEVGILGPFGSYDPYNRSSFVKVERLENLLPGEISVASGVFSYRTPGYLPEERASIYSCLINANDGPIIPGEDLCDSDATRLVSNNVEIGQDLPLQVYPNPIEKEFVLASQERVKSLRLVNPVGQVVQQFDGNPSNSYRLSNDVSPGLYTLQVQSITGEKSTVKVFVHQ